MEIGPIASQTSAGCLIPNILTEEGKLFTDKAN